MLNYTTEQSGQINSISAKTGKKQKQRKKELQHRMNRKNCIEYQNEEKKKVKLHK